MYTTVCKCAITVLHEQWMQRHTPITLCSLVTIWSLYLSPFTSSTRQELMKLLTTYFTNKNCNTCIHCKQLYITQKIGYRDQIVTRLHNVMGVCLCISKVLSVSELVYCAFFTIPICPPLVHRILSLLFLYLLPANDMFIKWSFAECIVFLFQIPHARKT